ncbi:FitA-like ribbon-helix-helix domain-containing protein [Allonocardiopsis opalescens]|uniref:Antitoxin FitA-like ribbon-helix-helix domain-containing protein n=1 Tax=Allonocardiopsis opalescens TaxID=1144618 RepID=A0A2T0PUH3_9ACTN|nr:hypothetical protein [Allonocardiopsis opalescens]PRX92553.1 hypothetical protein CLV72_110315 [Allonocardiopsis opalescens]
MGAIQIKDVPDEVRETLTAAARSAGQSLQSYLLAILEREARFARNLEIVKQAPLPDVELSSDEIMAAIQASRRGRDEDGQTRGAA